MQDHTNFAGPVNHMMVRDNRAITRDNHTRSKRTFNALTRGPKGTAKPITKELLEERVIEERRARAFRHDLFGIDVHNRRGGLLHQWRQRHLDFGLAGRKSSVFTLRVRNAGGAGNRHQAGYRNRENGRDPSCLHVDLSCRCQII